MMNLLLAGLTGIVLGTFFFGGLWYTVNKISQASNKVVLVAGSFIVRMGVVLSGFYLVSRYEQWQGLVAALLGFVIARIAVMQITKRWTKHTEKTSV